MESVCLYVGTLIPKLVINIQDPILCNIKIFINARYFMSFNFVKSEMIGMITPKNIKVMPLLFKNKCRIN